MRWSEKVIFDQMMAGLAADQREEKIVKIKATYSKVHRTAISIATKKVRGRLIV